MSQTRYKQKNRRKKKQAPWPLIAMIAGGFLLIIGAVFTFSQGSKPKAVIEVAGAPSIKVDKEKVDLGNEKLGQTVQVSFQLTNVGDQVLRFSEAPTVEVKEGC